MGVVYRDVFMGIMAVARDTLHDHPITEVMDADPRLVTLDTELGAFVDSLADHPSPVFRTSFVAIDEAGDYAGVFLATALGAALAGVAIVWQSAPALIG